jgi:hypothetical protein
LEEENELRGKNAEKINKWRCEKKVEPKKQIREKKRMTMHFF